MNKEALNTETMYQRMVSESGYQNIHANIDAMQGKTKSQKLQNLAKFFIKDVILGNLKTYTEPETQTTRFTVKYRNIAFTGEIQTPQNFNQTITLILNAEWRICYE